MSINCLESQFKRNLNAGEFIQIFSLRNEQIVSSAVQFFWFFSLCLTVFIFNI